MDRRRPPRHARHQTCWCVCHRRLRRRTRTPPRRVYAEDAAGTVAAHIAAQLHGTPFTAKYSGRGGVCYIEFGDGRVGKVDADFLSGSKPTAPPFIGPSTDLADEKAEFAVTRRHRWFGRSAS